MGIIRVEDLKPGMITSAPVMTHRGQVIISKDVELTKQLIARMQFYKIEEASIVEEDDEPEPEPIPEPTPEPTPEPEPEPEPEEQPFDRIKSPIKLSYSQKIQQSASFQQFQISYAVQMTMFNQCLSEFIQTENPNNLQPLLDIPKEMVGATRNSIEFFDMIHNLRQIDDTIFAHSLNVAMISRKLGMWLGFPEEKLDLLTKAASMHDIGKLLIPEEVLNKPGKLTDEEFDLIRKHPKLGYSFVKDLPIDNNIKEAILMHHERCDGSGYPNHAQKLEINPYALIISIADVYDAMTAKRVYRAPLCPFEAIAEFENEGYSKYHPKYILTFLEHIANAYLNNRVLLNDGRNGKIIFLNSSKLSRPIIQMEDGSCIDLSREMSLYIKATL